MKRNMSINIIYLSCLLLIVELFIFPDTPLASPNMTLDQTINVAGRQRMLSQRIAKFYMLKELDKDNFDYDRKLESNILEYEENLNSLAKQKYTQPFSKQINTIRQEWSHYKTILSTPFRKDLVQKVLLQSDAVLDQSHALVKQIESLDKRNTRIGKVINISGRQRMLSQRAAKLYYAFVIMRDKNILKEMSEVLDDFNNALNLLQKQKVNTKEINSELNSVAAQFRFAQVSFKYAKQGKMVVLAIESATEQLLKRMDAVTKMYVALS